MANPNLINSSSIYGTTNYLIPSTTSATVWTALTPAAERSTRLAILLRQM